MLIAGNLQYFLTEGFRSTRLVIARLCDDSLYDSDKIIWEIGMFSGRVNSKISGITYGVII